MHITVKKLTKNNSQRKDEIIGTKFDFGAGHSADFWWFLHFTGKDKNGLPTTVEVQLTEQEREKFMKDFSEYTEKWKTHINTSKDK